MQATKELFKKMTKNTSDFLKEKTFMIEVQKDEVFRKGDVLICENYDKIGDIPRCHILHKLSNNSKLNDILKK
jgi:hypothetical protein